MKNKPSFGKFLPMFVGAFAGVLLLVGFLLSYHAPSHKVLYVISSNSMYLDANLTYINSSGGTAQEHFNGFKSDSHPFETEYEMEVTKASGDPVYISAQLNNEFADKVHVEILVDGKLMQEASSTGTYSIATASGSVH